MDQFFYLITYVLYATYGVRALIFQLRSWWTGKDVSDL